MKKSILIVEDEESIVDILTYFTVHTAMTGEQALEKFQGLDIHLVILDNRAQLTFTPIMRILLRLILWKNL
ncbi:hypothetical protein [Bacillus dakarensis]|uniref:hypothetical protein n=1 Tax=Robertmurraya dakarensis TaxID=1926278 RepID=UPI000981E32E|nr:hypothetical protein [Bacillus dakarensis]